jgi:hypothetical protein
MKKGHFTLFLLWKSAWRFFKEVEIKIAYNPAIPFLGIYISKGMLSYRQ